MFTKKLLTLGAALLSLSFSASAQQMASCCARPAANLSASATEAFAMLAADKDFSGTMLRCHMSSKAKAR
jgi:carboxymethylenebutenolidase